MDFSGKTLIVIVGPTAVGKTAFSVALAKHFQCPVISADSRQFYKEMKIGTAKPSAEDLKTVKHYFIDSHSITDDYDAATFGEEASELINRLFTNHDFVIVCGGSGLYIHALLNGFDEIPEVPAEIREAVTGNYEQKGITWLQEQLKKLDPGILEVIDVQNPARLMRALEVVMTTGKSITAFQHKARKNLPYRVKKIGLEMDRERLYKRIDSRADAMIIEGLFEEAKELYPFKNHNALQTVGYQEVYGFMDGNYDREEAIRLLKRNSRRYAKRQLTWFKRNEEIVWFSPEQEEEVIHYIESGFSSSKL